MGEQLKFDSTQLNLYQKLAAITGEVGSISKGGTNKEHGYAFIEYAAVAGELRHLFAKYRVIIIPYMARSHKQTREEVSTKNGTKGIHALIDFTFVVINADKPDEKFSVTWTGEATDYGDKAVNKAATGALKYYLMRQFNISEKGDDPDSTTPDPVLDSVTPGKAAAGTSTDMQPPTRPITPAQAGMLLGIAKQKSGLAEKADVLMFFKKETGVNLTDVKQRDLAHIKAVFGEGVEAAS